MLASLGTTIVTWIGIVCALSVVCGIVAAGAGRKMFSQRLEFGPEGWSATPVDATAQAVESLIRESLAAQERTVERVGQLKQEISTLGTRVVEVERLLAEVS